MNFELEDKLYKLLEDKKLDEAIDLAEQELRNIPTTDFHKILGRNLLHLKDDLASYIKYFDRSTRNILKKRQGFLKNLFSFGNNKKPTAYYGEMNDFTINYDCWYIDLFSFENDCQEEDWEWLSDFYDSTTRNLTITGFEEIQKAYEDFHQNNKAGDPSIDKAFEVCELLVILRLQELFRATYKNGNDDWNSIPMFVTAHDYELIYKVN